jgi:hypothetical protein
MDDKGVTQELDQILGAVSGTAVFCNVISGVAVAQTAPSFFHSQHALKVARSTKKRSAASELTSTSITTFSPGRAESQEKVSPGSKHRSRPEIAVVALNGLTTS